MNAIRWNTLEAMPGDREFEAYYHYDRRWSVPQFHSHEYYEIYFFLRGDIQIIMEEYANDVHPYDVFLFPPGYMHRAFPLTPEQAYERFYIYVSRDCLRRMSTPEFDLLEALESMVKQKLYRFHLNREDFTDFMRQAEQIIELAESQRPVDVLVNRCRMNILLATLCGRLNNEAYSPEANGVTRMGDLIQYINQNISEPLSLDTLAERFFVSKYHLLHEFKEYTNTSIHQYIISKRILYARLLLQQGVAPGDVCTQCGFSDYAGFYRSFHRVTGMAPQRYGALARRTEA